MFLLSGNSIVSDNGVVRYEHLRLWAERGLIHIEDSRNNEYKVVSVHEMLQRMNGVQDMLINSKPSQREAHSHDQFDWSRITSDQRMIEQMVEVVERAKQQGMPTDPSACRDLVRRRRKTVVVPGLGSAM